MGLSHEMTSRLKAAAFMTALLFGSAGLWQCSETGGARASDSASSNQLVRHFVAFKFKESAKPEEIQVIVEKFKALQTKIPFVISIECGPNISPEHLNKGFTYAFLVTFKNIADRDRYLVHPEHLKFVSLLKASMEEAFVFDFNPATKKSN
jgi:hypothetical protein